MTKNGYSISDLERMTGIKAHTIRIWEKRYGIIEPCRTETNIRYYSDNELKKLLNISILNNSGVKISQIAELSEHQINDRVVQLISNRQESEGLIESMLHATLELNSTQFNKTITTAVITHGFENAFSKVFFPFYEKIRIHWLTGVINAAQQHFADSILRQKLIVALDSLIMPPDPNGKRFIIFLPKGHYNELCMLFFAYLIRKTGHKIIYLGQSVTLNSLHNVAGIKEPDALITTFTAPMSSCETEKYMQELCRQFHQPIYLSQLHEGQLPAEYPFNVKVIKTIEDFKADLLMRFPL
ncbi:MAG: MerR family transcriptional regulator [Bacteroidales bacterium]|nr:MerR family transcriptional regulator [Bacteroidales bacterium]MDD2323959.1 MerR family transcriptional regulator [Bacteroidales bacterium]MDD3009959.1 MerR family transcriptional regulator [Bacteroidales bacterium]MDD3960988.1 MerR family transcriptional regulator [Bacteroidales bacterium]MDY0284575.1 MerR family transcriptional regulator [Bacteroidales bacterium]